MRIINCFAFVILILSLFIGCGGDSDTEVETPPVNFISATPPGAEIAANATISITFDNTPTDVTVNVGSVTVVGKTAVVSGPFPTGSYYIDDYMGGWNPNIELCLYNTLL